MPIIYKQAKASLTPSLPTQLPEQLEVSIGQGMAVPFQLEDNQFAVADGIDYIKQSIFVILFTNIGARVYQLDFGSLLPRLIFESWTTSQKKSMTLATNTAIQTWLVDSDGNQLVTLTTMIFDDSEAQSGTVVLTIKYTINETSVQSGVSIGLTSNGTTQLPATDFTISGVPVFSQGN